MRESSVSIGVLRDGTVLVAYESGSNLYLSIRDATGTYLPPRRVAEGGVLAPRMRLGSDDSVLLVYSQNGSLSYVKGQGTELDEPRVIAASEEVEGAAALDVDEHDQLHASFIRDGAVNYGTNACAPVAEFSTDVLGKGVVWAKDTPNFVANRIGVHGMMHVMHLMKEDGLQL